MDKYKILIIGVVYNEEQKFLIASRSKSEKLMPGVYSYHVGEMHFNENEKYEALEKSLHIEVEEESGAKIKYPEYLSSHQFVDDEGHKVVAIAFLSKYEAGDIKASTNEVEKVEWKTISEIRDLKTLPVVHEIYESAYNALQTKNKLHFISVAGIVLNDKNEFMLVKDMTSTKDNNLWTIPIGDVVNIPGNTWEMLSENLSQNLKRDYDIEILDGAIPFTDQSFHGRDDFAGLVEFFIARVDSEKSNMENPDVVWKNFQEIKQEEVLPSIYKIFEKSAFFIRELTKESK
ncbi:NUDIX domain-containing protein [Candidatus Dojkabacteria bacterium]|uniref:NUDIX domain-containing protein n=1 Tax=Candidatus Dojkabacteria bacterium TaxID=2099670 RepID=A0A955L013_9BACT|nr:NUDIX domain-containing protein [Candidatus Dojkabacteria bacterium]